MCVRGVGGEKISKGRGMDHGVFLSLPSTNGRLPHFTGRYPTRIGMASSQPNFRNIYSPGVPKGLPHRETTVAESLRAEGYTTALFGKWHLYDDTALMHACVCLMNAMSEVVFVANLGGINPLLHTCQWLQ